jgi:hypothetical protein
MAQLKYRIVRIHAASSDQSYQLDSGKPAARPVCVRCHKWTVWANRPAMANPKIKKNRTGMRKNSLVTSIASATA